MGVGAIDKGDMKFCQIVTEPLKARPSYGVMILCSFNQLKVWLWLFVMN